MRKACRFMDGLVSAKVPLQVLVVDQVERPSEN
jgi:hypothetical protein